MLGGYQGNLSLHEQYPNWIILFASLQNYLNRASIRATLSSKAAPDSRPLRKNPRKGICAVGDVVEEVRTTFQKKNDVTLFIPTLQFASQTV